jgi:hypothetical protein
MPSHEVTVTQAAQLYSIPNRTIQKAAERGVIPFRRQSGGPGRAAYMLDGEAMRLYACVHHARRELQQYVNAATARAS